jgi:hypothetical protein
MKAIIVMIAGACLRQIALMAMAICLTAAGVQGQIVVFSNLTAPNNMGLEVAGSSVPTYPSTTWACSFTAQGNFNLMDVKVSVAATAGDPTFNVWLSPALGGAEPDFFIRWRQIGFGLRAPSGGGVVAADAIAPPIALTSGTSYWVVLTPANPQSHILWNLGGLSAVFTGYNHSDASLSFGDNNWFAGLSVPLQLQIDGTPSGPR